MKTILIASLVSACFVAGLTAPGNAQSVCPPANAVQPQVANFFFTQPQFAPQRDSLGLSSISPSSLRLLTDATDQAICDQLNRMVAPGGPIGSSNEPWAYYTAGGYYFLVAAAPPPAASGRISLIYHYVAVVDTSYRLLKGLLI